MRVVRGSRWHLFVLAVVGCLAAGAGLFVTSSATASTTATQLVITGIQGPTTIQVPSTIPGTSRPYVVVQAGPGSNPSSQFTVNVSFLDSAGQPAPLPNNSSTLAITSNYGPLTTSTWPTNGATSAAIVTSLATPANQVSLTVSAGKGSKAISTSSSESQLFDVIKTFKPVPSIVGAGSAGIGGDSSNNCSVATSANPVCGILVLPFGTSSPALLTLGACDATYAKCGSTKGDVVQALVDLSGGSYSKTAPATLIVKCDKSLCGGGAIQNVHLSFSLGGNTPLGDALACPAKNTIGADQDACVDYVQSKRDGSGDTHLYLLFDHDMRTSVG
jgi:hypothetical protein